MSSNDVCCICLASAQARGGTFLVTPGCCGKWFHQDCFNQLIQTGCIECPACRSQFPNVGSSHAPAPATASAPASAAPRNFFSNFFGWASAAPLQVVQSASPVATSRRFTQQTSFSSATEDPSLAEEDIIIVETAPAAPTSVSAAALPGLHLSVTPELSAVSTEEVRGFYSQVHVAFPHELANMSKKSHLDIVCIIDNSGSMGGSKIEHLKRAMEFVVGVLGDKDRLSVVTFNSSATLVHGLKAMTAANKALSKGYINRIHATGGTNIFDGMQKGWQVLERRQLRNTSSCVFLLTDGQDQSNLEQKKDLARAIRSSGSSLFLFGFGSDHDSAHMQTIANAAEGSFIYIDTNDTVVDAFGGAIGTQQGCILRHVRVDVTVPAGVRIESLQTGRYGSTVSPDGSSASVQYIDLFGGEQRDFLVLTTLPAVAAPVDRYQVLETEGSYRLQTTDSAAQSSRPAQGFIKRLPPDELKGLAQERHVQVDSHIVRIATTESLERALVMADQGNIAGASDLLMSAQERLRASPSFRAGIEVSVQLEQELKNALQGLVSRETYVTSRAMIQETSSGYGAQRVAYAKMAQSPYQSASSASMQGRAKASKGPPK